MKRLVSVLMVMAMVFTLLPIGVFAATDVTNEVINGNYTYIVVDSKATITKYAGSETAVIIPEKFETYPVTIIGDSAFALCTQMTSVVIPAGVISIGKSAFSDCTGLESVAFGSGLITIGESAFFGCIKLSTLLIPNSVTTIASTAFRGCTGLTSIHIGSGVTALGDNVFSADSKLTEVYFWGNAPTMGTDSLIGSTPNYKVFYFVGKTGFANPWFGHATAAFPITPVSPTAAPTSNNSILISWTASPGPITGYMVYRLNPVTSAYSRIAVTGSTSFTDTGRTFGETNYYKIKSYLKIDTVIYYSVSTAPISAKTVLATPASPTAVSASFDSIRISWGAVSNAKGYMVYRYNPATAAFNRVAVTTSTIFTDTGLIAGKAYYYKIKAYTKVAETINYSASTAGVTATPILSAPNLFVALKTTPTSARIVWSEVSGATGYVLYRLNPTTKLYERLKVTKAKEFTNVGLSKGIVSYKVRAYKAVNGANVYGNLTVAFTVTI
ncbi:MAG: leucine-rich repeat protein [Eubacteriales bacterium]